MGFIVTRCIMLYAEYQCDEQPIILPEINKGYSVHCINSIVLGQAKCPWYCNSDIHRGYMTEMLVKEHMCFEKTCAFLYRVVKDDTDIIAKQKLNKKELMKQETEFRSEIYNEVCILTRNMNWVVIIRVETKGPYDWIICYVALGSFEFEHIAEDLESKFNVNISFCNLDYDYDNIVQLIIDKDLRDKAKNAK